MCPQFHLANKTFFGSEDCLYANVFVPAEAASTSLPVMFWIFGGQSLNGGPSNLCR